MNLSLATGSLFCNGGRTSTNSSSYSRSLVGSFSRSYWTREREEQLLQSRLKLRALQAGTDAEVKAAAMLAQQTSVMQEHRKPYEEESDATPDAVNVHHVVLSKVSQALFEIAVDCGAKDMDSADPILDFLSQIMECAHLDDSFAVVLYIYVDRATTVQHSHRKRLSWFETLLGSLILAMKMWAEHGIANVDFTDIAERYTLAEINALERRYLANIDYRTTIGRFDFIRCCYRLGVNPSAFRFRA